MGRRVDVDEVMVERERVSRSSGGPRR
eukprot:COSAG01_NODE_67574_length_266_cov_1.538922_1_plen_26_part_01